LASQPLVKIDIHELGNGAMEFRAKSGTRQVDRNWSMKAAGSTTGRHVARTAFFLVGAI